ncbi:hypothetical protein [Novosphingobium beihaiensis]|uniref:Uncharacterized protein n=1 Tax=Novosphingobium beihaiensis TaxID=2930389 RepID=A0ABT0BRX5_9SPHN|nr:hypothetical protein [Novosphingobium beihaiensis]MCJ2187710.1 hypothetical protein [Novosphingobium beihaiensis]
MSAISSLALTAAAVLSAAAPQAVKDTPKQAIPSCQTAFQSTGGFQRGSANLHPTRKGEDRMMIKSVDLRVGGCRVIVLADKLIPEPPRVKKDAGFTLLPAR